MTHSMGIVLPTQPENVLSETSAGKRNGKITSAEYGNDEVQEDDEEEQSRRGFVRQTKPDHTLGASIAISIMSGGWALGGLSIWRREETSMGAGGWPKSHHPAECRPLESQWLLPLSRIMLSAATIGQRMSVAGAEDGYILGRHTRPRRP